MAEVPESVVEKVVQGVSKRLADPNYAQVAVGTFVQTFPDVSRFITAHADELGGGEAVIHVVFHAQVLAEAFEVHRGRGPNEVGFGELDEAAKGDVEKRFSEAEPALASYVASNVDEAPVRKLLAHIGLALAAA
jgi:hypothetical protein